MIFAFPYHDPTGKYNRLLKSSIELLQNTFESICVSATPGTVSNNKVMINFLSEKGVVIFENSENSCIGDHYRNALQLAVDVPRSKKIFFGFIDRVIFALNTEFQSQFLESLKDEMDELLLFERSQSAWMSHPNNYMHIEKLTNKLGAFLLGYEVELATCGFLIKSDLARKLLPYSTEKSYSAGTEWILLAYMMKIAPIIKKVDWLAWEDPFIEGIDSAELKKKRETSKQEIIKRLEMNLPFTELLVQKRFHSLIEDSGY